MELIRHKNGVVLLRSAMLSDIPHAFSTRIGGDGERPMNLRLNMNDTRETVASNLELFCEAAGINPQRTVAVKQVHSDEVIVASESDCGKYYYENTAPNADGIVTGERGIALVVGSADCVPILMYDPVREIVCAIHAGWRGTVKFIAQRGVSRMEELGSRAEHIRVAIGPCIKSCCFEVGDDVTAAVSAMGREYDEFVVTRDGKNYVDLVGINRRLLSGVGVPEENIDCTPLCTACESELFYSHRRDGRARGTMIGVISLK